jgi:hypothetical protein
VKLPPLTSLPRRATLLNDGSPVETVVNLTPLDHVSQKPVLRIRNLPVNEMANVVPVVKLEFDEPPR